MNFLVEKDMVLTKCFYFALPAMHYFLLQKRLANCFNCTALFVEKLFIGQGVGQTAQRAGVIVGVELPLYDICKHNLIKKGVLPDNVYNHFL